MDSKVLAYLANLAIVKQQSVAVLNVSRGIINQKTLHMVSAKSGMLDKLFVDVLLSGRLPGDGPSSPVIVEEEYVDISQRLREAKEEISKKNAPYGHVEQIAVPVAKTKKKADVLKEVDKPDEEVDAFKKLLREAESQVAEKAPIKTVTKKTKTTKVSKK